MKEKEKTDYSDELEILRDLLERNTGGKLSDTQFNEIFEIAIQRENPKLFDIAKELEDNIMGMLMTLDEATMYWRKRKQEMLQVPLAVYEALQDGIARFGKIIERYAKEKRPTWGTVGTLANIHEKLGKMLEDDYEGHYGYSHTVLEGMERHAGACKKLLKELSARAEKFYKEKRFSELRAWQQKLEEEMEGLSGNDELGGAKKDSNMKKQNWEEEAKKQETILKKMSDRQDEFNPAYMFNLTTTRLLSDALKGEFDVMYLIRKQLANRGVDENGNWVGFEQAKRMHHIG